MAGINLASAPNTLVGTSVSPLASDDTHKISFTLSVVALGSSNCSAITGLQGGAADTTSAVAAASGGAGGCAFSYSCTDCDLLGEETRAFTAPWSFQRIEYTLAVQPGDPAAPLVSLTHVLEAPKDKLLWADGADGDASGDAAAPPAPVPVAAPLKYSSRKIFQFVHEIVGAMASSGYPDLSLRLFLQVTLYPNFLLKFRLKPLQMIRHKRLQCLQQRYLLQLRHNALMNHSG
jgi:hypothetical protein